VLTGLLWISPWLVGFGAFMAAPIALSFYYSLTDYPLLEPPVWVGADNYLALANDALFWRAVWNTTAFTLLFVPAGTVLSLILASLLNQQVRGRAFFRAIVFLPSLVPMIAAVMVWMWLFNADRGLINRVLGLSGIPGPNWLGDARWAMLAMVIMSLWALGQVVVVYLAAMQEVPRALYEAAALDGAGPLRRFWHVTAPSISPAILFNVIVMTVSALQFFVVPYIMTEGGPNRATYMYTHYLFDNAFVFRRMGYASALAWVQFLITLALTGVLWATSKRLVHYRAA
jgi:multiple sugar transport system permease protein